MAKKNGKHKPKITPTDKPKKRIAPNEAAEALGAKVGDPGLLLKPEELKQLAGILHSTTQNVYSLCERLFNVKVADAIFDRLKKEEELFKCENCNEWMTTDCMDDSIDDMCVSCVNDIDDRLQEE